jgi:membrane protease YdiL (CAAX protease family)
MPETTLVPEIAATPIPSPLAETNRHRRLLALGLVLSVSFTHFIVAAFYYVFHDDRLIDGRRTQFSLLVALIAELTSLLLCVLWFVLSEHKRTWKDIGWNPEWMDIIRGISLIVIVMVAARFATIFFQISYHNHLGHYLQPRSTHGVIGVGISALSIVFVFVNPFFEELIVRGYTISEVTALGGSRNLAIFLSVLIQMSYHVYQGLLRCVALTVVFTIFSVYFSKTRRIAPVVLAHFWSDASALIRLAS